MRIQSFGGKPNGKRTLGRPGDEVELQKVRCGGMDWIELAQDRDRWRTRMNAVLKRRIP